MNVHWRGPGLVSGRPREPILQAIQEIGLDAAMTPAELSSVIRRTPHVVRAAWAAYERHWARFCGAHLDPQFWRLDHPARWAGMPISADGTPVVIVGTGPSLHAQAETLRQYRAHVHLFTSPRGAEALQALGLTPDLVLIEHQTPLDAHFSVQALSHVDSRWRQEVPVIATDTRTPAALLHGVSQDRLLVLDPLPTWGMWPATAAAIALESGASAVALLGVDLGTADAPDARQRPLLDLLALMPGGGGPTCLDLGEGAHKPGWRRGRLPDVLHARASGTIRGSLVIHRLPAAGVEERRAEARESWISSSDCAADAAAALAIAGRVRDGARDPGTIADLTSHMDRLLSYGADLSVRLAVQDGLGCAFLPRFWRTPPDPSLGALLWRPLALAAHELVQQHRTLAALLGLPAGSEKASPAPPIGDRVP